MKKNEFNEIFRDYVKKNLSPKDDEKKLISDIYNAVKEVLGESNCIQIGSYPRFTSITPVHDLDVLYIMGDWGGGDPDPSGALNNLLNEIRKNFKNPTKYSLDFSLQTHSVTVTFLNGKEEEFSIDIVPAYISGKNEFQENMYLVPEILYKNHHSWKQIYGEMALNNKKMGWIKSDPRGYIKVASLLNTNGDFRKSIKLVKAWKQNCKEVDESFALKSFHLEQAITAYFRNNPSLEIFDAVYQFFVNLPVLLSKSSIPDRADHNKKIDDYVDKLSETEIKKIIQARDMFLIRLEEFTSGQNVADLVAAGNRVRKSSTEEYLFDKGIPVLIEEELKIGGFALQGRGGFMPEWLDQTGVILVDRKIEFQIRGKKPVVDIFKWKVKNDDRSDEPRGEITDHQTRYSPESTKYVGKHHVECYGIRNGICVARARQNVELR